MHIIITTIIIIMMISIIIMIIIIIIIIVMMIVTTMCLYQIAPARWTSQRPCSGLQRSSTSAAGTQNTSYGFCQGYLLVGACARQCMFGSI